MDTPNLTEPEKNWHESGCIVVSILQYIKNEQPPLDHRQSMLPKPDNPEPENSLIFPGPGCLENA